ncbi:uncharacterized protein [Antedon mediterranea]|uniref:uncharacterized protein n=1 Tax=Antedon mediterranea TaxID=105859 RepID=UPI003AF5088B
MPLSAAILVCLLVLHQCNAQFGVPIKHGVDKNFEKMGQASIGTWLIEDGVVTLDVVVEDVENEDEIWILDWQPYNALAHDKDNYPIVNRQGGYLLANNTGPCSSVFANEQFSDDFYDDAYRPGSTTGKNLFTSFTAGASYAVKTPGSTERFREDTYTYQGTVNTLFDCLDSNGDYVWKQNVYPESIVLNATIYMTNVRPKYADADGSLLPSYTENYAVLYWTLMRFALSRFLISSTERLRPIFEYAIVKPVYINADEAEGLDRSRAEVELVFRTVTDSDGYLISVYQPSSLQYNPINTNNGLSYIAAIPDNGCNDALGMESGDIVNGDIIATSFQPGFPGHNARLHGVGAWCPVQATAQHVQVTFGTMMTVTGVITQGYTLESQYAYITTYKIQINQVSIFADLEDSEGNTIIFNGNFDAETPVPNFFDRPIEMIGIRIAPITNFNLPYLRFEILGCEGILEDNNDALTAPECDYEEYPGMCTQRWIFGVVLDVDEPATASVTDPLDATGEFELSFKTYTCPDIKSGDKSTCERLDVPDAVVSNLISLQSVVDITDGEIDEPRVLLKSVYGSLNPNSDLRDGFAPGVSHLEMVSVETHFFPEVLRQRLQLELTMFMVCIGKEYEFNDIGCLAADTGDRYFAYIAEDFYFKNDNTIYNPSVIEDTLQELESHSYDHANEEHVSTFINRALSGQARNYTITNVFQLVERTGRRRRDTSDDVELDVVRRDVLASASVQANMNYRLLFRGCPEGSTHSAETLDCICNHADESYSDVTFRCERIVEEKTNDIPELPVDIEIDDQDSGCHAIGMVTLLVTIAYIISIIIN